MDRDRLADYGGPATLSVAWSKSLLKRMDFTKKRGSTKVSGMPDDIKEAKQKFLSDIVETIEFKEIPGDLIFNWDQTGINLVPSSLWTMDKKGKKRVEIAAFQGKHQITAVMRGTLMGEILPFQLIYAGKTTRYHQTYQFPSNWQVTHSPRHWSNEETMLQYIHNVIILFVDQTCQRIGVDEQQPALAIFDHFKGQMTEHVIEELEDNCIHSILVPANYTGQLQPMDISANKVVKSFLKSEFAGWYSDQLSEQFANDSEECVDLSTARMKCIGARWLVKLYEHLENNPHFIVNGFKHAGIFEALNILTNVDDTNLVEYSHSSSENSVSDIEEDEVVVPDNSLRISDVYSESEPENDTGVMLVSDSKTD